METSWGPLRRTLAFREGGARAPQAKLSASSQALRFLCHLGCRRWRLYLDRCRNLGGGRLRGGDFCRHRVGHRCCRLCGCFFCDRHRHSNSVAGLHNHLRGWLRRLCGCRRRRLDASGRLLNGRWRHLGQQLLGGGRRRGFDRRRHRLGLCLGRLHRVGRCLRDCGDRLRRLLLRRLGQRCLCLARAVVLLRLLRDGRHCGTRHLLRGRLRLAAGRRRRRGLGGARHGLLRRLRRRLDHLHRVGGVLFLGAGAATHGCLRRSGARECGAGAAAP
mmetsp:Transcript_51149/g.147603  ORF Transcript_51149/g.147603 Transcript_51149/m.147603 type:complete len:274 (+) Transcript_51149:122-943(+)